MPRLDRDEDFWLARRRDGTGQTIAGLFRTLDRLKRSPPCCGGRACVLLASGQRTVATGVLALLVGSLMVAGGGRRPFTAMGSIDLSLFPAGCRELTTLTGPITLLLKRTQSYKMIYPYRGNPLVKKEHSCPISFPHSDFKLSQVAGIFSGVIMSLMCFASCFAML